MQTESTSISPWLVVLVPMLFGAGVFALVWFIGFASGWRDLARTFPGRPLPNGQRRSIGSIRIDWVDMAPVDICVTPDGIHLENWFQIGAKSVFLPWGELHERFEQLHFLWPWRSKVSFAVGTPRRWRLALPANLFVPPRIPVSPKPHISASAQNPSGQPNV